MPQQLLYKLDLVEAAIILPSALKSYCNMLRLVFLAVLCVGSFGFVPSPPVPDHRIVGGLPTTIAQHPHQVSLRVFGYHNCGGSIISNKWVVTAGHCVGSSTSDYTISAGSANKNGGIEYSVNRTIRHPQYNSYTIDYDIALVEINGALQFNASVNAIRLASVELPANSTVNITGWGALKEGGESPTTLMQVTVPIVDRKSCAKAYEFANDITTRMICAGIDKGGKDACQGDSGGPLTSNKTLYGIVSWGYGCARPKYPGVYTNVAELRPWIRNVTGI